MKYVVVPTEEGVRLDRFVAVHSGVSRTTATRLIEEGQVYVGRRRGRKGTTLTSGDEVEVVETRKNDTEVPPTPEPDLPLAVLYEDAAVLVVNKEAGLQCHPLRAGERGTVAGAVLGHRPDVAFADASPVRREAGLCHRLDQYTSGALLFAKTREAWTALRQAFQEETVDKRYLALCQGTLPSSTTVGKVEIPLRPGPRGQTMLLCLGDQVYSEEALSAETHFEVLRRGPEALLLGLRIKTGRRHQIRAHLAGIGLPLYGDTTYGGPPLPASLVQGLSKEEADQVAGQFLHASELRFVSPATGQEVVVSAPLYPGRGRILTQMLP